MAKASSARTSLKTIESVVSAVLLAAAVGLILLNAWVSDDAYITLRTVDNFVAGRGLTWNPAERVQAYTHPLWMLLLSAAYWFTREAFLTTIAVSVVVTALALLTLVLGLIEARWCVIPVVAVLLGSKAFVDYSTSGLENPLSHLLVASFLILLRREPSLHTLSLLSSVVGFAVLVRQDLVLLLTPPLLGAAWPLRRGAGAYLTIFIAATPAVAWHLFSLGYYGFLFPNTAFAKLGNTVSRLDLVERGLEYVRNSFAWDPVTLPALLLAVLATLVWRTRLRFAAMVLGIGLYLGYVVAIGGDFMSGRFMSVPLFAAVCLVSSVWRPHPVVALTFAFAVLAVGWTAPRSPLLVGPRCGPANPLIDEASGIADERIYYCRDAALVQARYGYELPRGNSVRRGHEARESGERVVRRGAVGYFAFIAGPNVHVIDVMGLGDPLLARLPPLPQTSFRVGHFERGVPPGYDETLKTGTNQIADPRIAAYYDRLRLVVAGEIFDPDRLETIVALNLGQYDYLIRDLWNEQSQARSQVATPLDSDSMLPDPT